MVQISTKPSASHYTIKDLQSETFLSLSPPTTDLKSYCSLPAEPT